MKATRDKMQEPQADAAEKEVVKDADAPQEGVQGDWASTTESDPDTIIADDDDLGKYRESIRAAASEYREDRGWCTVPVNPDTKSPTVPWRDYQHRYPTAEEMDAWSWPGVAIVTGGISDLLVLDVDGPQGFASLGDLEIPLTVTADSPHGTHHYFRLRPGQPCPRGRVGLLESVDVRAEGNIIIGPPTARSDGGIYRWRDGLAPGEIELAFVPDWIMERLLADPVAEASKAPPEAGEVTIRSGQRNDALFRKACSLQSKGWSREAIQAAVEAENEARCDPPLQQGEVGRIVDSALGFDSGPDRTLSAAVEQMDAHIEALLKQAEDDRSFDVWSEIPFLASLDPARLGRAKSRLKKLMLRDLNLNELDAAIRRHRRDAPRRADQDDGARPRINTNRQMSAVVDDIIAALALVNDPPTMFVRNASLVRVNHDEHGRPFIEDLDVDSLRGIVARAAVYLGTRSDGSQRDVDPPERSVRNVLRHGGWGDWGFPTLHAIAEGPLVRPDGTVACEPGYDPAMQVYMTLSYDHRTMTFPHDPSAEELERARECVLDVLVDFPFIDAASRANAVALLLLPLVRHAFDGQVPLAVIDAPQPGTGKSLLAEVVSLVHTGRPTAVTVAPRDEEEWRKRLTTIVKTGMPIVAIDNVNQPLDNSSLAGLLTAGFWADRALRSNDMISSAHQATWLCTGNNIVIRGDLVRRCYWTRLDAECSTPWQRDGFRHENLKAWVLSHRVELLAALVTMVRGWYAAGCPAPDAPLLGSFEEWTRVVGGILQHAGIGGFLANMDQCREEKDDVSSEWEVFLTKWWEEYGEDPMSVAEILEDLRNACARPLLVVVPTEILGENDSPKATLFGQALARNVDVRFGPYQVYLRREKRDGNKKACKWSVRMGNPPPGAKPGEPLPTAQAGDTATSGEAMDAGNAGNAGTDSDEPAAASPPAVARSGWGNCPATPTTRSRRGAKRGDARPGPQ